MTPDELTTFLNEHFYTILVDGHEVRMGPLIDLREIVFGVVGYQTPGFVVWRESAAPLGKPTGPQPHHKIDGPCEITIRIEKGAP